MGFWSFWVSGAALASVPLVHWYVVRRPLAVSGRYTALVDSLRFLGERQPSAAPLADPAALIAALRAQTALELGADALESAEDPAAPALPAVPVAAFTTRSHLLFFLGLVLGGALAAAVGGGWALSSGLRSDGLARLADHLGLPSQGLLLAGGLLVGAGTRMAGGCTSGHGLCGVSQLQPGSLLATAAFFGAAVACSFALGALL
jgi:uncharacterized membrane protein YedE/YeeE